MKKYSVQLAILVLFSALFASGMAIGMEKELPSLPPDVRRVIANKKLRLILDEAERVPEMIISDWGNLEPYEELVEIISLGYIRMHNKPVIDFIILLIENGADPNTKNYNGNTVLHLLAKGIDKDYTGFNRQHGERDLQFADVDYLAEIELKIGFLARHKININAQDDKGNTIAHILLSKVDFNLKFIELLFIFLQRLGLDITIKNSEGFTPCEVGQQKIQNDHYLTARDRQKKMDSLNRICSFKK